MASSSNSSVQKSFKYDVFLSFRGEDTRNKFVSHLYEALQRNCIETYKDDERIKKGERINDQLLKSIEDSRFYIIVFSKNYASSSWCLDELVKIIECHKMPEHTAFPVFYDVEPTEVRKHYGPVRKAFSKHENQEAAGKWRDAMKELANLAGWELKLHSTNSSVDGNLVGMETRISDVLSSLDIGTLDVRMIGIKGIGGGGKTTLARAVYDQISNHFDGKSFVENVREVSKPSLSGLKELQKRILEDVLNKIDITFSTVHDGKNMLKATMRRKKILVVLDDVDRIEQLEALAGSSDWFESGSRVIITTRDEQLLLAHGVNFVHYVNLLSSTEAICLFTTYAFRKEIPFQGYEELSGQVVQYANGLPLTIKVLASFLCGKDKLEWVDAIKRLKKIPLKDTLEKLEVSYISLEDEYKEILLDIACILKGRKKEYAIAILESCGFHARIGLKVLEQRSLITISKDEVLGMHDHIEEMGKNIVRRSHPDEPNKHSHLWIDEEIEDILANDMGTEATRCLKLDMWRGNSGIFLKGLGKMKKLRYLHVTFENNARCNTLKYDDTSKYFPNSLKYLECWHYPFLYLPKTFQANNLVRLEMSSRTTFQLWKEGEKKVLTKLKFLSVSRLPTFDFRITPNLETLVSSYLTELYMPVCCQKLKHLNMSHSKLRTFDLGLTPNLETLSLEYSYRLVELCMPVSCQKLKHLYLRETKLRTFDLGLTPNLETLSLCQCPHFVKLHVSVACPNLKFLDLSNSRLRSLDLELIPNLERLYLQKSHELLELNAPAGCLKKVGNLNLSGCLRFTDFEFRDRLEPNVSGASPSLDLVGESLDLCPLHPNSNLLKLCFRCSYYEFLPPLVGNIEKLMSFGLCVCTDLKKFSDMICSLQCLKKLTLDCNILEFPKDLGQLECLEELCLNSTKIKHLPDSICVLKLLKSLEVNNGDLLEKLPEDLGQLECLEKLFVSSKKIEYLPDSICMLKRLKSLDVTDCCRLGKLPGDIGQLECLERLYLSSTKINHLPDGICMLEHLKYLNLFDCALLEKLPEDLGRLECLEHLDITYTGISHLPQSIFGLKGLVIDAPPELLNLFRKAYSMYEFQKDARRAIGVPLIEDSCKQIIDTPRTNAKTMGPVPLPTKKRIYCELKSAHVHKDARFHFEIRTRQRLIDILHPTAQTIDSLIQLDLPGVDVEVKL
ncbi:disease resistance TIR-NBS-LRR class family protein [Tanacetum coccineum]